MWDLLSNKLFPYIKPYRGRVIGAIILSFILATIGGLQVALVRPLLDKGLSPDSPREDVVILALQLLVLGLVNFPCRFYHFYWLRHVMDRATCQIRAEIFEKFLKLPASFYSKSKQGELISNAINDTQVLSQGLKAVVDLIREPLKAMVYLGMAFWNDWQLTLVIFAIAPFLIVIFDISGKKVRKHQGEVQEEHAGLTQSIAEGLSSYKITRAFNLRPFVFSRFSRTQENYFGAQMKTTFVEEFAHPLVEVIGACAFSAVIVFAHYRVQSGETTVGEFIAFIAALALFMDPIRKFSQGNVKLGQARAASERISRLMDLPEEVDIGNKEIANFSQSIEVNNLNFSYGDAPVITNLSLSIKKGQKVALVGLSGSGKSTLIGLLLGLYPVKAGEITIDGISIGDIKLTSLRNLFGLVSQDVFLFHDTIRDNLCLGKDISDLRLKEALDVANATEFVSRLPVGLETIVGDRGARLSGGQQQRVTIARAYLQNPDVLLFDEATSALDNESEKLVQEALARLGGEKTVLAVAHRLSTIQDFDRIYVLHEGKLVEEGSHAELLAMNGEYAKLYALSKR
jgi:subfamily B ATP-binding cassette protein MsbA